MSDRNSNGPTALLADDLQEAFAHALDRGDALERDLAVRVATALLYGIDGGVPVGRYGLHSVYASQQVEEQA